MRDWDVRDLVSDVGSMLVGATKFSGGCVNAVAGTSGGGGSR